MSVWSAMAADRTSRAMGRSKALRLVLAVSGLALALTLWPGIAVDRAAASDRRVPVSQEEITLSFAPLVGRVGPAVVNIYTKTIVEQRRRPSPLFDDPFFRRFFGNILPGQPSQKPQQSLGSGVILDAEGLIATNAHVIDDADVITVVLSDRREFDATLLLKDERTDLAILEIDTGGEDLPFLEFRDSDDVEVGDLVLAIGNPFGVGQTVTSGIVSALARTTLGITDYSFFIQTDAAINPGNSGGALVTMDGALVGINTAIFSNNRGGASGGSIGIGFAVPSNMVKTVLQSARGGRIVRPWIGVSGQSVTSDMAQSLGLDRPSGVIVNRVYPEGPADDAGLMIGDIILALGGREVQDNQALRYRVATKSVGDTVDVRVNRKGEEFELAVPMVPPLAEPQPDIDEIEGRNPFQGATVANLSPAFALENNLDDMASGVVVLRVRRGTAAASVRIRPRDLILKVDDKKIGSVEDLKQAVDRKAEVWKISIKRGDRVLTTELRE